MGRVTETPATEPAAALAHFTARLAFETDPSDVHADLQAGAPDFVVLDTRSETAYVRAHVPGAVHLPHAAIDAATAAHFLGGTDRLVVCYCWGPHCNAADKGAAKLAALGYRVKVMIGGIEGWRHERYPIEGTDRTQA